jgi:capsular polysaccharide biosynthesis protein
VALDTTSSEVPRQGPPAFEEEREVDFAAAFRRILERWWLVAAAVAIGAVLGYLASLGGGEVFQAKTTVYLGQPLSPTGGAQIQSLATNPSTVNEIVRSEAVVQDVAGEIDVQPGALRRGISKRSIASADARARQTANPLVEISVRGPWRGETARAANLLAASVVENLSGYVDLKVRTFEEQLAAQDRELEQTDTRLDELQRAAQPLRGGLTNVERLTLLSLIGLAEQRRGQLIEERTATQQLITLAETVERPAQVTEARAVEVPAKSKRSSIIVGALIGLLAGSLAALLWGPLAARRRRTT